MDEERRPSGIPRVSRLPVPRGVPPLRQTKSRESLRGPGELRPSRLRAVGSRDSLASPSLFRRVDSDETPRRLAARPAPARATSSPKSIAEKRSFEPTRPAGGETKKAGDLKRRTSLARIPSDLSSPVSPTASEGIREDVSLAGSTEGLMETPQQKRRPRQSLAERTVETLSHIPSSPALSRKPSSFFGSESPRPVSRAGSSGSRPGSSYSRPASGHGRPGSSSGNEDLHASGLGTSSKPRLSRIEGTPDREPHTPTPAAAKTPVRSLARRSERNLKTPSAKPRPTPTTQQPKTRPRPASTIRQPKTRQPANSLSRPSKSNLKAAAQSDGWDGTIAPAVDTSADKPKEHGLTARKSSAALREHIAKMKAAKRAAVKQGLDTVSPEEAAERPATPVMEEPEEASTPVKGTPSPVSEASAVNETPTRNKTPTRNETPRKETPKSKMPNKSPGYSSYAEPFEHDNPFNQPRAGNKVLHQRLNAARTSGRLNIAALGFKEMPDDVLKIYDLEMASGASWAESVDLSRLMAADNEIEVIDDKFFPDVAPEEMDEEAQGNIFGGLESMDLHGNHLISVPQGLRQLHLLTSLNLVRLYERIVSFTDVLVSKPVAERLPSGHFKDIVSSRSEAWE